MGNNMCPYTIATGGKYTYFTSIHNKFIENDNIEEGTLLNVTNGSLDPFNYHLEKCGVDCFRTLERNQIHTFYPHIEEDAEDVLVEQGEDLFETNSCNGTNEVIKIFNQKIVICYERDSDFAFRQCGHQCIFEQCYQNKGDIDILKCVF